MIFDLLRDTPTGEEFDICIVGAGAAGISLAVELARRGKKIALLEGGGPDVEDSAQEPYQSEVAGRPHGGLHGGRFRAHGGTTKRWGGQILELADEDFERRAWIAASGWPLSRSDLSRFYARALKLEGVSGAIQDDAEVWRALGQQKPEFGELESYLSRWCPEPDFSRLHRSALEGPAIAVWLHTNAVELLLDHERVRSVRVKTQTGKEAEFRAREFVFCLGGIESVRFFLQPRAAGLPWNRSGLLGRHWQDHIDANIATVKPRSHAVFSGAFDNIFLRGYKYHPKVRLSRAKQQRAEILNCAATMSFSSATDELATAMKATAKRLLGGRFSEISGDELARMARHSPLLVRQTLRYAVQKRAYNPAGGTVQLRAHCEQQPDSASAITLSTDRDSLGLFRTRLDWRISVLELRTLRELARTAVTALDAVAEVTPAPELMHSDDSFAARCDDSNHHMGGMRMDCPAGPGVVNTDLLLHGTRNCYICSAAVFPTSGFSNPTHTVLALAVRLAEHLTTL